MFCRVTVWSVVLTVLATRSLPVWGIDFSVSTKVYVGDKAEASGENLTVFSGDRVYDFMEGASREITVFDGKTAEFDLIDPSRKVWTTLSMDQLLRFTAALKLRATSGERIDRIVRFAANPSFSETYDERQRQLVLRSPAMTYRATGVTLPTDQSDKYHRFCNSFSRLNSTRPGALPPYARLQLNQKLSARGTVPSEITLSLAPRRAGEPALVLRSKHKFSTGLTASDRAKIDLARVQRGEYDWVPFHRYRGVNLTVAASN